MENRKQKKKKLSVHDKLTIFIKRTKPLPWIFYLAVCIAMVAVMLVEGNKEVTIQDSVPEVLTSDSVGFRMTIVGDINIDDSIRTQANAISYSGLFKGIKNYWDTSDYVMANINGPVLKYEPSHYTSRKEIDEETLYLRPRAVRGMNDAGINLMSFANEDVFNYGITGINSTIEVLEENNIHYLGIAKDSTQSIYQILEYQLKGETKSQERHKIAVFCVNDIIPEHSTVNISRAGIINSSIDSLYESIYEASQECDQVIAYVHFGGDGKASVSDSQKQIAHAMVDAGASLVVGSHSHMVQSMEQYNGGLIVYGLGDFVATGSYSNTLDSVMLDYVITRDNKATVYLTPVRIEGGKPTITTSLFYKKRIISSLIGSMSESFFDAAEEGIISVPVEKVPKNISIDIKEDEDVKSEEHNSKENILER